uniref:Uncharacterized protein n=1 Tax=Panagrolaimus davidi TaxID=227884 RepID=A0A914R5D5_9BILA
MVFDWATKKVCSKSSKKDVSSGAVYRGILGEALFLIPFNKMSHDQIFRVCATGILTKEEGMSYLEDILPKNDAADRNSKIINGYVDGSVESQNTQKTVVEEEQLEYGSSAWRAKMIQTILEREKGKNDLETFENVKNYIKDVGKNMEKAASESLTNEERANYEELGNSIQMMTKTLELTQHTYSIKSSVVSLQNEFEIMPQSLPHVKDGLRRVEAIDLQLQKLRREANEQLSQLELPEDFTKQLNENKNQLLILSVSNDIFRNRLKAESSKLNNL